MKTRGVPAWKTSSIYGKELYDSQRNPNGPFITQPLFLEKCRKVVLEKWSIKLGFFFLVNHFSRTRKKVDLYYKTTFFSGQPLFSNHFSRTRFLKLDFLNQISTNCKNRGRRINGPLVSMNDSKL